MRDLLGEDEAGNLFNQIQAHKDNAVPHVSAQDRAAWNAVAAVTALLVAISAGQIFVIRLLIQTAIQKSADDLLLRINGTYIRRGEYDRSHSELVRRLDRLEDMGD